MNGDHTPPRSSNETFPHASHFERSADHAIVELVKAVDQVVYHGKRRNVLVGPIIALHTLSIACRSPPQHDGESRG